MKSVFLFACVLLISACGKSEEEETYYTYRWVPADSSSSTLSDPPSISNQPSISYSRPKKVRPKTVHNPAECPNLNGTYRSGTKDISFSKTDDGVLLSTINGGTLPVDGRTLPVGKDKTLSLSCMNKEVLVEVTGDESYALYISEGPLGTVSVESSQNDGKILYTKIY